MVLFECLFTNGKLFYDQKHVPHRFGKHYGL